MDGQFRYGIQKYKNSTTVAMLARHPSHDGNGTGLNVNPGNTKQLLLALSDVSQEKLCIAEASEMGFDVTRCENEGVLTAGANSAPGAVIVLEMDASDSRNGEVCRQIRSESWGSSVVVLLVADTAAIERQNVDLNGVADGYLAKPFSGAELRSSLRFADRLRTRILETHYWRDKATTVNERLVETYSNQSLHDSRDKQLLEAVVENAATLIVATDRLGSIRMFSRACEDVTGYTRREVYGKNPIDLFVPEDRRELFRDRVASVHRSKRQSPIVVPWLTRNGELRSVEWRFYGLHEDTTGLDTLFVGVDVTESQATEQALRRQELELRTLIANVPDYVLKLDADGRVVFVNRYAAGFRESEVVGRLFYDLAAPEDREVVKNAVEDAAQKHTSVFFETRGPGEHGPESTYDVRLTPVLENEVVKSFSVVSRDTTERLRAAGALRVLGALAHEIARAVSLEDALNNVLSHMCTDGGWSYGEAWAKVASKDGSYMAMSTSFIGEDAVQEFDAVRRSLRFAPGEGLVSQVWKQKTIKWVNDLSHAPERTFKHRDAAGRSNLNTAVAIPIAAPDDVETVLVFYRTEPNYKDRHWPIIAQSIQTQLRAMIERIRVDAALRDSEKRYRGLFEQSNEAIFVTSPTGRITAVNPAFVRLAGRSPYELLGMKLLEIIGGRKKRTHIRDRFVLNRSVYDIEVEFERNNGEIVYAQGGATAIYDPDGRIIGYQGAARDVTKQKRVERELRDSQDQLRRLAGHLQQVREDERTLIAREIHDELGQALTAIHLDLASLQKTVSSSAPLRAVGDLAKRLSTVTHRIDETIDKVRNISYQIRPSMLDDLGLDSAVQWYIRDFEQRTGIEINLESELKDEILDAEVGTAIFRILQESLTNVARHAKASTVKVSLKRLNGNLQLQVEDNGVGFDERRLVDSVSLGLVGMRERANAFNGRVSIESHRQKGTSVTVTIPERPAPTPPGTFDGIEHGPS